MPHEALLNTKSITKNNTSYGYPANPITETIINGFFTIDRKWTVKGWNKAAEKILGIPAKDIIGKNLWEKFAGIIPKKIYSIYNKAFQQEIPVHFQEYWGEMGAWFDVIAYYSDDALSVSFKSSKQELNQDNTKNPEQRLKNVNELYRFVTEVTNDCLWEWDLQTREIFWIDGGHERVFGYKIQNAIIPQSFWENHLHPEDKKGVLIRLNKTISDGAGCIWEDEYRFQKANGDYAWVHDRGQIIYDAGKKAVRMIGATQDISEKILLENKLVQERNSMQRELTAAVFTAQENERAEIGKELHDNLGQLLLASKMYIQMAMKSEKNHDKFLKKSTGYIENVIEEVRRISKILVIPPVNIISLTDNIKNLVSDLILVNKVKIIFHFKDIVEEQMNKKIQVTIFRIIQEQVNNILKHAHASKASIDLSMQEDQILLVISDNGRGCDLIKEKDGVGLINIKSRAEFYGGTLTILSLPGKGFELKVLLPLKEL
jgi:PAS domain S-box-containing protein